MSAKGAYLFSASVRENLFYGLKQRPVTAPQEAAEGAIAREKVHKESLAAGNSTDDPDADWVDYAAVGVSGEAELVERAIEALKIVDMESDIYRLGIRGTIDAADRPDLAERFLAARAALRERLEDPEIAPLVEVFDARPLQRERDAGREPAVRHAGGRRVRHGPAGREPLRAVGAGQGGADRGPARGGAARWPRPWSSCSPTCRPATSSSSSSASSAPTTCPSSRRC